MRGFLANGGGGGVDASRQKVAESREQEMELKVEDVENILICSWVPAYEWRNGFSLAVLVFLDSENRIGHLRFFESSLEKR